MKRLVLLALSIIVFAGNSHAYSPFWQPLEKNSVTISGMRSISPTQYTLYRLQEENMQSILEQAFAPGARRQIELPTPTGKMLNLSISNSGVLSEGLAKKYPNLLALKGEGARGSHAYARIEYTTTGLHAMVFTREGTYFIEPLSDAPNNNFYQCYYRKDYPMAAHQPMSCGLATSDVALIDYDGDFTTRTDAALRTHGTQLRTYRLALACTYEYATAVGGATPTKASVLSAMVVSVNRVSGVYEKEFAVALQLIPNTDTLIFLTSNDPYSNSNGGTMLGQNQTTVNTRIGAANYDIGHVFSTGGGGIASLGCVCNNNSKAQGVTGSSNPVGDPFDIDYVAHEMGHQFGADHTFNAATGSCAGNGVSTRAYEPGSGSTIMAYAGICGTGDNLQNNSDAYFHAISLNQVTSFITNSSTGGSCPVTTPLSNTIPDVAPFSVTYEIPSLTPFEISGPPANDTDHTELTYCWEEWDRGDFGKSFSAARFGPIFRSFLPDTANFRTFPKLSRLLNNQTNYIGEKLPDTARRLNFKLTVRDVKNGYGAHNLMTDTFKIKVNHIGQGFAVLFPSTVGIKIPINRQVAITWQLGGSDLPPINCSKVDILLSTDGGYTWPHVLKTNANNDGIDTVLIPIVSLTNTARIKVRSVGNIFFDISDKNFQLVDSTQNISGLELRKAEWSVYPNPATGQVSVSLPQLKLVAAVKLTDAVGKCIWVRQEKGSFTFNVSSLPAGVYFISVTTPEGERHVKQIIVREE